MQNQWATTPQQSQMESFPKEAMSLSKTLKHLRYKGNTIIEKGATFAIKNKNTSKYGLYAKITEVNKEKGYVRYSDSDTKRGTIDIDKFDGIMSYEKNK